MSGLTVSQTAIYYRFISSAPLFSKALVFLFNKPEFNENTFSGYSIQVADCTNFSKRGTGAAGRIHYVIDLFCVRIKQAIVTTNHVGETFKNFLIKSAQIWIGDRIYCNVHGILHVKNSGSEVIVRYNFGAMPVFKNKKTKNFFDVIEWLRTIKIQAKLVSCVVFVKTPDGSFIKGRLIGLLLPPQKAREAQIRTRKEYKTKTKKIHLERAKYVVVFTTIPSSKISNCNAIKLYRLRWQVELQIKRDKSIAEIDFIKFKTEEGVKSWLLGHLLAQEIAKKMGRTTNKPEIEEIDNTKQTKIGTEQNDPWILFQIGWLLLRRAILAIEIKLEKDIREAMKERLEKTERRNRPRALEAFLRQPPKKTMNPKQALKKAAIQADSK